MVEYALIIVLITAGTVLAIAGFGGQLRTVLDSVVNNLGSLS
jgi:Flp pilus assembly pilin Flp